MTYGLLEYEQLKFLREYNFKVLNFSNGKYTEICLITDKLCITYHEWPQFNDFNIIITKTLEDRKNHSYQAVYGDKWFMENVLPKYKQCKNSTKCSRIDLVSFYLHDQLENHRKIFDISI